MILRAVSINNTLRLDKDALSLNTEMVFITIIICVAGRGYIYTEVICTNLPLFTLFISLTLKDYHLTTSSITEFILSTVCIEFTLRLKNFTATFEADFSNITVKIYTAFSWNTVPYFANLLILAIKINFASLYTEFILTNKAFIAGSII